VISSPCLTLFPIFCLISAYPRCGVAWPRSEEAGQRMSRPIATPVRGAAGRPTSFQAVRWDELPVVTAEPEI